MNPYAAQINVDGSCYSNPGGNGGYAGILEYPDNNGDYEVIFNMGYEPTTNNRMELMALIEALKYVKNNKQHFRELGITEVEIHTDSENALRCHRNAEAWRSAHWLGRFGNPIRNIDLLKELLTLKVSIGFSCKLYHIQNKSTPIAKEVDRLAKKVANSGLLKRDAGYIQPRVSRTRVKSGVAPLFNAIGQEEVIRVFEHSPVSRRKDSLYKIKFEVVRDGALEKYYAHTTKEIDQVIDKHHFYLVSFNAEQQNPMILSLEEIDEAEIIAQWD